MIAERTVPLPPGTPCKDLSMHAILVNITLESCPNRKLSHAVTGVHISIAQHVTLLYSKCKQSITFTIAFWPLCPRSTRWTQMAVSYSKS